MKRTILPWTGILLLAVACAPRLDTRPHERLVDQDDERQANREAFESLHADQERSESSDSTTALARHTEVPILPVTVLTPAEAPAERGEGEIDRSELQAFIEAGPHRLLAAVSVDPIIDGNAFRGFRVAALDPAEAVLDSAGLRVGDVVTAVNGQDISQPDGFMRVWQSLPEAEQLQVEIVRGDSALTLAWHIE